MHKTSNLVQDYTFILASDHPQAATFRRVIVGSPAWFSWLGQIDQFHYTGPGGHFTARKERRGEHFYWYAYLKHDNKLYKKYIAKEPQWKIQTMTQAKLASTARALWERARSG